MTGGTFDDWDAWEDDEPRAPFKPPKRLSEAERLHAYTLAAELDPGHVLCPLCCESYVLDNLAGRRHGVCHSCYLKGLAAAAREEERQLKAKREYDRARQELSRTRRRAKAKPKARKGAGKRQPLL